MSSAVVATRYRTPSFIRTVDVTAKATLLLLLALALMFPEMSNMKDKAAGQRAVAYPMLAFTVPVIWVLWWRARASFPWLADLLVTITCFTDILGNRMDLYDSIWWFDDWMHFMNNGLLAAAVILLTLRHTTTLVATAERALAFGATAAIVWELAEYFAFISKSSELQLAYTDTLGDLALGTLGSFTAALVIHAAWRRGHLRSAAPQLELPHDRQL